MKDYLVLLTSDDDSAKNSNGGSSTSSGVDELLLWTREHIALLSTTTTTILVKSQFVADRLLQDVEALNEEKKRKDESRDDRKKMPCFQWKLDVEVLLQDDDHRVDDVHDDKSKNTSSSTNDAKESVWDLIFVSKVLSLSHAASANSVVGIFYFPGKHATSLQQLAQTTALNNIVRICQYTTPTIPLALNRATASLCVKALFYTRIAYVIFNPAAGQRPAEDDMATLKRQLEPFMRLKIFYTEKDRSIAEQASEIVDQIKKEQTQQMVQATVVTSATHSVATEAQPHAPEDDKFIIIASGGDGTVSAIAGATLNSGIPVGIIPRGTANAFSVALGIPTNSVEEACQLIVQRTVREVDGAILSAELLWHSSISGDEEELGFRPDLGIVHHAGIEVDTHTNDDDSSDNKHDDNNTSYIHHIPKSSRWINHAGLGFEAGLVDNATRELKDKFGNLAYTIGAAQQILRNEQFRCTFVVDGDDSTEKTVETNIITIANVDPPSSIFAQGFGKVIPDDGLFEVTIGTSTGLEGGIQSLAALVANTIVKDNIGSDKLLCFRCREIRVTCDPPQKLLMDGEVIRDMDTVTFTCVSKGLKVIAPLPRKEDN
jgi:diacylglycerol kinase family enzyme